MTISPDDMLTLAENLSDSSDEATIRTSIGRSYYGAYHHGLEYLGIKDTKEWFGGRGGVHQKLIDELAFSNDKPASYILSNLKARRHLADYDLTATQLAQEDAKASIILARSFLEKINA